MHGLGCVPRKRARHWPLRVLALRLAHSKPATTPLANAREVHVHLARNQTAMQDAAELADAGYPPAFGYFFQRRG